MKKVSLILIATLLSAPLRAEVRLAPLFGDGAVLQQGKPVPVWGTAEAGARVTVEFARQKKETVADAEGRWKVELDPLRASSEPSELVVTGDSKTFRISDVLVGEVWFCSGQSNMEWSVARCGNAEQEIAAANYPAIRHFKTARAVADAPVETFAGKWAVCSPETAGDFSAAAYYFAREIHKTLGVPVGLVNSSYGGSPISPWMSEAALRQSGHYERISEHWEKRLAAYPRLLEEYKKARAEWEKEKAAAKAAGKQFTTRPPQKPLAAGSNKQPSGLYNGMIHPLLPFAIRGILWYQGETSTYNHQSYAAMFKSMIQKWREDFGQGDVPFYFVQLPNYDSPYDATGELWAFLREAQAAALELPNTGMAVAIDIGDPNQLHPPNKQDVGRRLALHALARTYERPIEYSGPVFERATRRENTVRLDFADAGGLHLKGEGGFELAGADGTFHPAEAKVEGASVVVVSAAVPEPVAVRYAWKNNPPSPLYNAAGLPASPFRVNIESTTEAGSGAR